MHDIGPSGGVPLLKREIVTQGYESEDVEILETPEERRSISEPPADEPATGEALVETDVSIGVTLPETVPAATKVTALGINYTEVTQGMMISTEVTTTIISAPPGNDHNSSFSNQFSYTILILKLLQRRLTAPIMGPFQEEATTLIMMDIAGIDVLYHNIIKHQPIFIAASMAIDETTSAPSTMSVMEQIELQPKPTSGPISILTVSSASATTDLRVITSPGSPMMVVEPTSPTFLAASTLVSMKTPPRLQIVSSIPLRAAPAMPSMIVIANVTETSPSGLTCSLGVIEVGKEFMTKMIDNFYKGLK